MSPLLARMTSHRLRHADQDQTVFEWMYAHTAHAIVDGSNPFVTTAMNVPKGVNLLANTSMLAIGTLFTPVTLAFGAPVTYALVGVLGLFGTASAWYWLWRTMLGVGPLAAWVGGLFCGFCPAIVAQTNGHQNMTTQFFVPVVVHLALGLGRAARPVRHGMMLGLAIVVQFFIGPELLFDTAIALGLFVLIYPAIVPEARARWRGFAKGLPSAAATAALCLAYPIHIQFSGPQSYKHVVVGMWRGTDVTKIVTRSVDTFFQDRAQALRYAPNGPEQGPNYGWLLVIALVVILAVMWGNRLVRAAWWCAAVLTFLGLGASITYHYQGTWFSTPWRALRNLPLFDSLLATRFHIVAAPFVGLILAVTVQRLVDQRRTTQGRWRRRVTWAAAGLTLALVPITPTPLQVVRRQPVPNFIADGTWRTYVAEGRSIVFVPIANSRHTEQMAWQADQLMRFSMPGGYFLGPVGPNRVGSWPANDRPTAKLLLDVAYRSKFPVVTPSDVTNAAADLCHWRADIVVLPDSQPRHAELKVLAIDLFGEPTQVSDVLLWDVRSRTTAAACATTP